jgi:hypothetical protein
LYLLVFLKQVILRKMRKEMEFIPDRRQFKRFLLEFEIEVIAKNLKTEAFRDRTLLKNISGEGANFITHQSGSYYIGQPLELIIYLPATKEVKGCVKAKATVVRMESASPSAKVPASRMNIALKLETPFSFERLDLK